MDAVILTALVGLWVLVLGAAAVVPLLPAARPGHEAAVFVPVRRRPAADETRAA